MPEEIQGTISDIRFKDRQDGWSPGRITPPDNKRQISVVGKWYGAMTGARVKLTGDYTEHPQWGKQFAFTSIEVLESASPTEEVLMFLEHRMPGVGPVRSRAIIQTFGDDATRVLEEEPELLAKKVSGISPRMAAEIQAAFKDFKFELELARALRKWKLEPHVQAKAIRRWGKAAAETLEKDPFELYYHIEGVGFDTADRARQAIGIGDKDPRRLRAALCHTIQDKAEGEGSTCLGEIDCINHTAMALGVGLDDAMTALASALESGYLTKAVIRGETLLWRTPVFIQERAIAEKIKSMLTLTPAVLVLVAEAELDREEEHDFLEDDCGGVFARGPEEDTETDATGPEYVCAKCAFKTHHRLLTMLHCCRRIVCPNCFDRNGPLKLIAGGFAAQCPCCQAWMKLRIQGGEVEIIGSAAGWEVEKGRMPE